MSLEQKEIVSNMERYVESGEKYGFMNDKLLKLLGQDFIKAPASTMTKLHNAFEGGLVAHILELMEQAFKCNKYMLKPHKKVEVNSLMKVAGLCQIGKAHLYVPNDSKWHRENLGKMYEFNEDLVSMRVGERSLFYALSCGIDLTEEECAAILNHDKKEDDAVAEYHNSNVGFAIREANRIAIFNEKN